jgi:hypothetical protein
LLNNANTDELHLPQRAQDKGGKEREYDGAARALRLQLRGRRGGHAKDGVGSGPAAREKESPQMRRRGGQIQISHSWVSPTQAPAAGAFGVPIMELVSRRGFLVERARSVGTMDVRFMICSSMTEQHGHVVSGE